LRQRGFLDRHGVSAGVAIFASLKPGALAALDAVLSFLAFFENHPFRSASARAAVHRAIAGRLEGGEAIDAALSSMAREAALAGGFELLRGAAARRRARIFARMTRVYRRTGSIERAWVFLRGAEWEREGLDRASAEGPERLAALLRVRFPISAPAEDLGDERGF